MCQHLMAAPSGIFTFVIIRNLASSMAMRWHLFRRHEASQKHRERNDAKQLNKGIPACHVGMPKAAKKGSEAYDVYITEHAT